MGIFRGENEEPQQFSENELSEAPFIRLKRHSTITSIANHSKKLLKGPDFFVITQIQRQLTSDICWVITGIFLICVIEAQSIMSPSPVTTATVIYECVSAFGNVGASTGYPNTATSQAGQYRTLSKLVLIALMYRGRHRGKEKERKYHITTFSLCYQVCLHPLIDLSYYLLIHSHKRKRRMIYVEEPRRFRHIVKLDHLLTLMQGRTVSKDN